MKANISLAAATAFCFFAIAEGVIPAVSAALPQILVEYWIPAILTLWFLFCISATALLLMFHQAPVFKADRRRFLGASTTAACSVPAAILGAGVINRKDFLINEVDIRFPNLPTDLQGLRLLQISDIHMGPFFSRNDLVRVVDACNGLRADLAFITGDLITTVKDPLDDCIFELSKLKSPTGIWGCMGNHELYAKVQRYTKERAAAFGMDFLRYEGRTLRFGKSKLNLVGVDFENDGTYLRAVDGLIDPQAFNLLLAHTPEVFPTANKKGFQLTLSGHTHGGQINLQLAGANFNIVDLATPYTKGLYWRNNSAIYVNSGLGTIGIPMRIGAPPEITVIRLCNS